MKRDGDSQHQHQNPSKPKKIKTPVSLTVKQKKPDECCIPRGPAEDTIYTDDKDLEFQIVDWYSNDVATDDFDNLSDESFDDDDSNDKQKKSGWGSKSEFRQYTIRLFGVNKNGHSVTSVVNGFNPYFYIKVPSEWNESVVRQFIKDNITHKSKSVSKYDKESGEHRYVKEYQNRNFCVKTGDGDDDKVWCSFESALVRWKIVLKHDLNAGFTGIPAKKFKFVKLGKLLL